MGGRRLYQHLRESGIKATLQEAFQLREAWLRTFKEMNLHFARTPLRQDPRERYAWIPASDDDISTENNDPKADKRKGRQLYEVTTITGFKRNRTVINSCLNTEFQNPVAHLAKEALWNFERAGLGNRLLCFVHDEADYWAYPNEVRQLAPIVERLWLEPGRRVFPHVMLKCETSLSLYWDKGGVELKDVEWTANGEPILEPPPFVQQAYAAKST